jgi:hypothetical protein
MPESVDVTSLDTDEEKMDEKIRMGWPWETVLLLRRCIGNSMVGRYM